MSSGDLDGDKYFLTWDPSLLPLAEATPLNRAPAGTSSASRPRQLSDVPSDAVQTFMQLKFNALMGQMANEWSRQVENTPQLANAPYPLQLVPLIEAALVVPSVLITARLLRFVAAGSHEVRRGLCSTWSQVQRGQGAACRNRHARIRQSYSAAARHDPAYGSIRVRE